MAHDEVQGGRALRRWVGLVPGRSYSFLAQLLGVTTQSIYEWRHGISRPGPDNRRLLEEATGIEAQVWTSTAERVRAAKTAKRLAAIQGQGEGHPSMVRANIDPRKAGRSSRGARSVGAGRP